MKLSQLVAVDRDAEVLGIQTDSRKVKKGDLFLCLKGWHHDGHDYAAEALKRGAVAIVSERRLGLENEIVLPDTRQAAASLFSAWYGYPQRRMKIIGVTGTNGKTSVVHLLNAIYQSASYRTATAGTLGFFWKDKAYPSENTTALPETLYARLREMADDGVEYLFMEVSSHALVLGRVAEITFHGAVYTNLTPEHMDFHKTMESYAAAKARLFEQSRFGVFHYDDPYCYAASQSSRNPAYGFGRRKDADYRLQAIEKNDLSGLAYRACLGGTDARLCSPLVGDFNIENTLAAAATALTDGAALSDVQKGVATFRGVRGRLERLYDGAFSVFLDYAHTPDALFRVLTVLRRAVGPKARLRVLFGCGGDRDRTKRPLMGDIATTLADDVIVTSDNARSENPSTILEEIVSGIQAEYAHSFRVIQDRREALEYAIDSALPNDVLLVAGKGHEDYEIDCHGRHPFSEREILSARLRKNGYGV